MCDCQPWTPSINTTKVAVLIGSVPPTFAVCTYTEDARWHSTARRHPCAAHWGPFHCQVSIPQVCCANGKLQLQSQPLQYSQKHSSNDALLCWQCCCDIAICMHLLSLDAQYSSHCLFWLGILRLLAYCVGCHACRHLLQCTQQGRHPVDLASQAAC